MGPLSTPSLLMMFFAKSRPWLLAPTVLNDRILKPHKTAWPNRPAVNETDSFGHPSMSCF